MKFQKGDYLTCTGTTAADRCVSTGVPLLPQPPLEFPPAPPQAGCSASLSKLVVEPMFSAPAAFEVCRRSRVRLMEEMQTHSLSTLPWRRVWPSPDPQAPDALSCPTMNQVAWRLGYLFSLGEGSGTIPMLASRAAFVPLESETHLFPQVTLPCGVGSLFLQVKHQLIMIWRNALNSRQLTS